MDLLDRYIGRAVLNGVLGATMVMMTLDTLITFAGETGAIGHAKYTIWYAIGYVLLSMPQELYQYFPMIALLGTMFGLGMLASHSELIAMRAAGLSVARISYAVLKTGLILAAFVIFIGEVIAPPAIQYAKLKRVSAMNEKISLNTDYGLWARDGGTYIHVRRVESDGHLVGVNLYIFDDNQHLQQTVSAAGAQYKDDHWELQRVNVQTISPDGLKNTYSETMQWQSLLNPEVVNVVSVTPENLSAWKLHGYIDYLKENQLDASRYKLTFWTKVASPLTIAVMILLAVPFVFGSLRDAGMGKRIVIGFMLGLGFYLFNTLSGQIGLVYRLPAFLAATLPTLSVMVVAVFLLYRTR
ncbi:MAG: LPS export ABC transporter permease LptG [Gammaproteobacteria bacterium]|nr:LPS export ABC transporter permease LptG [Gammaproteobacteria bacterium]